MVFICITCVFANGENEQGYPSKDIQFYVNADAGGGTDSICRKITQLAEKQLGGSFYLVNKPGVADAVGPSLIMAAKPDGYTIGNINYGSAVTAVYQKIVNDYSMDRLRFIALVTEECDAIMVSKRVPYRTFGAMIEAAKANPGKIKVGDQGIGSRVYLCVRKIEETYKVKFNKVSYSSSASQREAMLNGEIDVAVTSLGDFASLLKSGDAVGVCEFSSIRNATYPTVPTCLESGMGEDFLSSSFLCIAAPKDIPDAIALKLESAFKVAVESKEFKDWTASIGITPHFLDGQALKKYIGNIQKKDFVALDELKKQGLI